MAGIGFQLKRLYRRRGILARIVAVGYAGVVTTGPLILGLTLMSAVSTLGWVAGMGEEAVRVFLTMATYALVFSQVANSLLSNVMTRYASDMLFEGRNGQVMGSLLGALSILLPISGVLYGIFLALSNLELELFVLNETLFLELVCVWMIMSYLMAVKDYRGVLGAYLLSLIASIFVAWLLCGHGLASVTSLMGSVCVGYGIMMVVDLRLLGLAYPRKDGARFEWLGWIDRYPRLVAIGVCTCVGLFSHLMLGWLNPELSVAVEGLFRAAPSYDIPSLYAVLSTIPTTIVFVSSTESEFYPTYRRYVDLLNGTGTMAQIDSAQEDMLDVMRRELRRLVRIQAIFSLLVMGFGTALLDIIPPAFTPYMNERFLILCVAYGFYGIGNVLSLMLMYFSEYGGTSRPAVGFACAGLATSLASLVLPVSLLGVGFLLSSVLYLVMAYVELRRYLKTLPTSILLREPLVPRPGAGEGAFTHLGRRLDGTGAAGPKPREAQSSV